MKQVEGHVRGDPNARLKLVEYADFECPYCAMAYPYVKRVVERYRDTLAEIFFPFPLPRIHPHALHAAQAAEAAGLQGKFWEMHDKLFENREHLDDAALFEYAGEMGLDMKRFEHDVSSPAVIESIKESERHGVAEGVTGTPAFFLNGEQLQLERFEDLEKLVAQAEAKSK